MLDPSTPSAAEIEAAVDALRFHHRGEWLEVNVLSHNDKVDDLAATIATLTARAEAAERARDHLTHKVLEASLERQQLADRIEAAEALLVVRQRDIDEQVRCGEAREKECEALAAQVAKLEAALTELVPIMQRQLDNLLAQSGPQAEAVFNSVAYKTALARMDRARAALAPKEPS